MSCAAALLSFGVFAFNAHAATSVATYQFNDTLDRDEIGSLPLGAVDPLTVANFTDDVVFGVNRRVYEFGGNADPASDQGGLSLGTTGLLAAPDDYSVEMIFKFFDMADQWRRIIDTQDRQDDSGFYVAPDNKLGVYPIASGTNIYVNGAYHHVVLTVSGNVATAYLDGQWELSVDTDLLNLDNPNNLDGLLYFFLDNSGGSFNNEYSGGRVALIHIYDGELTAGEAADLAAAAGVPEPASVALLGAATVMLLGKRRVVGV
ncbi:MAG: LamG-like jellyroll fold domain-containing protein [Phycisphaeraceae bacterium]